MPNIKHVQYVRFRITDLQAQKQFLEDFGFQTRLEGDLLMARGTDDSPYIYLAQEAAKPGFVCLGFAAESADGIAGKCLSVKRSLSVLVKPTSNEYHWLLLLLV